MGRCVIKLNDGERDWWLEWSTVVDAPVTYGMTRAEMRSHLIEQRLADIEKEVDASLARADTNGASWQDGTSLDDTIAGNRAGPKEGRATLKGIITRFCVERSA